MKWKKYIHGRFQPIAPIESLNDCVCDFILSPKLKIRLPLLAY